MQGFDLPKNEAHSFYQATLFDMHNYNDKNIESKKSNNLTFSNVLHTKSKFLDSLKSQNGTYKRYTKSPLRYGGGKSLAVGLIIENLPSDVSRVISPFFGGGSVEIALALELGIEVRGFDIFDILANFWQVALRANEQLIEALSALEPSKANYEIIKNELKLFWNERHKKIAISTEAVPNRLGGQRGENSNLMGGLRGLGRKKDEKIKVIESKNIKSCVKTSLDRTQDSNFSNIAKLSPSEKITLARNYYFNFNLSYGPGFLGWMSSIYEDKNRYLKMLEKLKNFGSHKNAKNLSVECADFVEVFAKYPQDFFYLDPPYFLDGDSKMFRGIYPMRNFPIHHNNFNHELLAGLLKKHKGRFILSYNDCEFVRTAYKDFKILTPKWQYTMGQGETRIGKNRKERGDENNVKTSHELLIIKE